MSATPKQIKLIEDMQSAGAPIPEHPQFDRPDDSMFKSVEAADAYIKANMEFYHKVVKAGAVERSLTEISNRLSPADWGGIPNH